MSLDPRFEGLRRLDVERAVFERQVIHFDLNSAVLPMSQFAILEDVIADINTSCAKSPRPTTLASTSTSTATPTAPAARSTTSS